MYMVSLLLIVKENRFLLLKRSESEHNYSNYWGLPGGSVEENETPTDAVIREVYEEMGVEIPNVRLLKRYPYHNTIINVFVYNSSEFDPNGIVLNEEHTQWGMFSYYDLHQMRDIIPSTLRFISDYLQNGGM